MGHLTFIQLLPVPRLCAANIKPKGN